MSEWFEDWPRRRLEELSADEPNSITDGPFGSNLKTADYVEQGAARVIRLGNIKVGEFDGSDVAYISGEKFELLAKHEAKAGDLVIAALAEPVGRAALVPDDFGRAIVKADCVRFRPGRDIDRRFLLHALNSPIGLKQTEEAAHGIGRLRVNLGEIRALEVPVPHLREQRRIVAKLDALRARSRRAKEALAAVPALLDRLRQSILAAAFRGDLTADWRAENPDVEPASELLKRIRVERRKRWEEAQLAKMIAKGKPPKDDRWKAKYVEPEPVDESELPELPDGWCWASVDDLSELQLGQQRAPMHTSAEEQYPYVRAANIKWDGLDLSDVKTMGFPDRERYRLEPGDVLLSEASGSATEVGKPAIWRGEIDECYYQKTLLRARPWCAEVSSEWLYTCFLADAVLGRFARMAPGVGILHLTAERMLPWPVPLAPSAEQACILASVRAALETCRVLEGSHETISARGGALDSSILAAAFRGELVDRAAADGPVLTAAP